MKNNPMVTVLLPNYNGEKFIETCLSSVFKSTYLDYEVIMIDDGSTDKSIEIANNLFSKFDNFKLIRSKHLGASGARALGMEVARGEIIVFLDNDAVVSPDWLEEMVKVLVKNNDIGMAQCKMRTPDGKVMCAGEVVIPYLGWILLIGMDQEEDIFHEVIDINASSGATGIKKEAINKIGLYDRKFLLNQFEDMDFSMRTWVAGYRVVLAPKAVVIHDARIKKISKKKDKLIQYVSQRNCIRMLLKNYSTISLIKYLPTAILGMYFRAFYAIYTKFHFPPFVGLTRAIIWHIFHLPSTLDDRRDVQKIRKFSDSYIFERIGIKISPWRLFRDYLCKGRGFSHLEE